MALNFEKIIKAKSNVQQRAICGPQFLKYLRPWLLQIKFTGPLMIIRRTAAVFDFILMLDTKLRVLAGAFYLILKTVL